ncbi:MAG: carbon starvation protein A [Paludibacteraceae bacterium]|nr:carbon starvation protein A [Paludibacteraceae bacterium]
MISFSLALVALVLGYVVYGWFTERVFAPDDSRPTPAVAHPDGVDYVPMKAWRMYMIQFLNIAGLGPIFGAVMGAKFGVASYLWIVLGTIFGGAVHDYLAGMISLRNNGANLPVLHEKYLGTGIGWFSRVFSVLLMILVGAVFISGPAALLSGMTPDVLNMTFWIAVIFLYYMVATMLPIDKIIGKVYPLFAVALLIMAVGVLAMLYVFHPSLPELTQLTDGTLPPHPQGYPIFPMMFISIACGAISGFHATQSPLMARCMTRERQGRRVFYAAMVTEGVVALIWAAAAIYYFGEKGMGENNAAVVVKDITSSWLGRFGGLLAVLGVVAAPITSGDTALRSARLMVAEMLHYDQKPILKRLAICIPLFLITFGFLLYSQHDADGFGVIWRYFAWANQTMAALTLWTISVYLWRHRRRYVWMTLLPALFMTTVCATYICYAPEGFGWSYTASVVTGEIATAIALGFYIYVLSRHKSAQPEQI